MTTSTTPNSIERTSVATLEVHARDIVRVAAALASFCEHVEHNEPILSQLPNDAARRLRVIASKLAFEAQLELASVYLARIRSVEEASLYSGRIGSNDVELSGADSMMSAHTWQDFQLGQIVHDRQFHPDVFGLSKIDQLRHYTFHVMKLAGLLVDAIDSNDWPSFGPKRLADIAIFGVKIATACNDRLPAEPLT
jgi:hypothetical protein